MKIKIIKVVQVFLILGIIVCSLGLLTCRVFNKFLEENYNVDDKIIVRSYFGEDQNLINKDYVDVPVSNGSSNSLENNDNLSSSVVDIKNMAFSRNKVEVVNSSYNIPDSIKDLILQDINSYYDKSSFYFIDLIDGTGIGYNIDSIYQSASIIKAAYCLYLYKALSIGNINFDEHLTYTSNFYSSGSGILKNDDVGSEYSVRELVYDTIVYSDNIAYKMLHHRFGVLEYNKMLDELGVRQMHLSYVNPWGLITLRDMALIWQEIYNFALQSSFGEEYLNLLSSNAYNYFSSTIPNYNSATKEGFTKDVTNSSGILFGYHPYLLLVSAKSYYDGSSYYQVKKELRTIGMLVNDYEQYMLNKDSVK